MMKVFKLSHVICNDGIYYYSPKLLGFFASVECAQQAMQYYLDVLGFLDSPNGFIIEDYALPTTTEATAVYCPYVYIHDEGYECEYAPELGCFASFAEAEMKLRSFLQNNDRIFKLEKMTIEEGIDVYEIGEKHWAEGFS